MLGISWANKDSRFGVHVSGPWVCMLDESPYIRDKAKKRAR